MCYVYFRFPHGDHGGPALVSYPEIDRAAGVYGSPEHHDGEEHRCRRTHRIYVPDRAGRLRPTDRFRPT